MILELRPPVTHGSVQGTIHAWHTGARPGFFQVRDLSSGDLVRCVYKARLYHSVHKATSSPKNVVHVYGSISWDRATNGIVEISVDDIELAQPLSKDQFDRLFGSAPRLTGEMSTYGYIDWLRGDGRAW